MPMNQSRGVGDGGTLAWAAESLGAVVVSSPTVVRVVSVGEVIRGSPQSPGEPTTSATANVAPPDPMSDARVPHDVLREVAMAQ